MKHRTFALCLLVFASAPLHAQTKSPWITLFNGSSTSHWRGYNKSSLPAGWKVVNGALTRVADAGDIVTKESFGDFELQLDWKIAPGGNSGIFFHVHEDTTLAIYMSAPEMQVLDNARHADGKLPTTSAGSNFALHAPVRDVSKPAGQWNSVRLIVKGPHVEHWLNGVKILEYELGSYEWKQLVAASKFKAWPTYGTFKRGQIGLQDHGDEVAFRNIRIRKL